MLEQTWTAALAQHSSHTDFSLVHGETSADLPMWPVGTNVYLFRPALRYVRNVMTAHRAADLIAKWTSVFRMISGKCAAGIGRTSRNQQTKENTQNPHRTPPDQGKQIPLA